MERGSGTGIQLTQFRRPSTRGADETLGNQLLELIREIRSFLNWESTDQNEESREENIWWGRRGRSSETLLRDGN